MSSVGSTGQYPVQKVRIEKVSADGNGPYADLMANENFSLIDTDGDNKLSKEELTTALENDSLSQTVKDQIQLALDNNMTFSREPESSE